MSDPIVPSLSNSGAAEEVAMTRLLDRWQGGDPGARDQLIRQVLPELRDGVAARLTEETPGLTSEVTAMVADGVESLLEASSTSTERRGVMMCLAVELVRRVLVDAARAFVADPVEAGKRPSPLEVAMGFTPEKSDELIQVDEALDELATFDAAGAQAVALRYFGGLPHAEMASAMDLSESKALMVWVEARAWLYMQFQPDFLPDD